MLIAGDNRAIRDAFTRQPEYWLRLRGPFDRADAERFRVSPARRAIGLARDARRRSRQERVAAVPADAGQLQGGRHAAGHRRLADALPA